MAFYDKELCVEPNWRSLFIGQRCWPRRFDPLANIQSLPETQLQLVHLKEQISKTAQSMPSHQQFIAAL